MGAKSAKRYGRSNRTVRSFQSLARDYYEETFERFPTTGSAMGLARFNARLGRATPSVHERQERLTRRTLAALEAMALHDFEGDDRLDRATLVASLRTDRMMEEQLKSWQRNPQIHLERAADSLFMPLVRNADRLGRVAGAIAARLKEIPRYLDEAAGCIARPDPLWTELARTAAPGVVSMIGSLPEALHEASGLDRRVLDRRAAAACKAVRAYAARIGRKKAGPRGGFAVGRERFEELIRERLGLNISAREARAAGEALAERLKAELKTEARRFHRRKTAQEILEEAASQWRPEGRDLLSAYRRQMGRAKAAFRRAGAMTFPRGEKLEIKAVPEFMRHQFPTAAYSPPGPLERDQRGIFWVNDLSQLRTSEKEKQAEVAQHFGLELTSAHEAYPGHHLQFVTQNRHPSYVRRFADHAIYYEGWTLWCEQMAVDFKISDNPYLKLIQLNDALWRANRIVIDCGLQTGEMTYEAACRRLVREVGFTMARARADVNWYTSSPTIPMSYLLGKMELLRLKRERVDRAGWTLKQFNDWVLGFGAIPWSWIEASGI